MGEDTPPLRLDLAEGVSLQLPEEARSMAMQKHVMFMTKKAVEFVNPSQIPVVVGDSTPCIIEEMSMEMPW